MKRRSLVCLLSGFLLILASCNSGKKSEPTSTSENNAPASTAPAQADNNTAAQPAQQPTPQEQANATQPPPQAAPSAKETPTPKAAQAAVPEVAHKAPPAPQPVVIPEGTVVAVRLDQAVSSKTSHTGDRFEASLAQPVVVKGKTIVPTGAVASGTVTSAQSAGKFKGAAALSLVLDTLVVHGTKYHIQTMALSQSSKGKGKRTATMVGGGAGAGALIGGIAGGGKGAAIGALVGGGAGTAGAGMTGNNNDITLPVESAVSFQLTAPVTLKNPPPAVEPSQ
jgi:glucose/arabinose dehydrogenase